MKMKNIGESVLGWNTASRLNVISIMLVLFLSVFSASQVRAEIVNINKADAETLQENLKGVGDVKSKAIIDYRNRHGRYKSIEDLKNVPGIGEELVRKNRGNMSLTRGLERARERHEANEERKSSKQDRKARNSDDEDDDKYKKEKKNKSGDNIKDSKSKKDKKSRKDKKDSKNKKDKQSKKDKKSSKSKKDK